MRVRRLHVNFGTQVLKFASHIFFNVVVHQSPNLQILIFGRNHDPVHVNKIFVVRIVPRIVFAVVVKTFSMCQIEGDYLRLVFYQVRGVSATVKILQFWHRNLANCIFKLVVQLSDLGQVFFCHFLDLWFKLAIKLSFFCLYWRYLWNVVSCVNVVFRKRFIIWERCATNLT